MGAASPPSLLHSHSRAVDRRCSSTSTVTPHSPSVSVTTVARPSTTGSSPTPRPSASCDWLGTSGTTSSSSRRRIDRTHRRWADLARATAAIGPDVVVDAGSGPPPTTLQAIADVSLLVTRPCYLALTRAQRSSVRPHGVVLVDEPWRALRPDDISAALGVPVVAVVSYDPKIARAVDSGLAVSRLPATCLRQLRNAA